MTSGTPGPMGTGPDGTATQQAQREPSKLHGLTSGIGNWCCRRERRAWSEVVRTPTPAGGDEDGWSPTHAALRTDRINPGYI